MKVLKTHLPFLQLFFLVCVIVIGISSCKKEDGTDNTPPPVNPAPADSGTLLLHLHNFVDETDIGEFPGLPNTDNNGREITINTADFYMTAIQLIRSDGAIIDVNGPLIFKVFNNVLYQAGKVPVGTYTAVKFNVGIDSATNMLEPGASPDSALLNNPDMWFGSSSQPDGYIFMNIEGSIDTSASHTFPAVPFSFKIGTNANYVPVTVPGINITISKNQANTAHMVADYNDLFNGIQINVGTNLSITNVSQNSTSLATSITNNISQMFKAE